MGKTSDRAAARINLHIHSTFSDGLMHPEKIIEEGIAEGLTCIGFAEHFRSLKLARGSCLEPDDVASYVTSIKSLAVRYEDRINVFAGLEIAFSYLLTDFTSLRLGSDQYDLTRVLDYILFEYVGDPQWAGMDLPELLRLRPIIKIPVGLAHCDFEKNFSNRIPARELAVLLARNRIFLELCPSPRNARMMPRKAGEGPEDLTTIPYYRIDSPYVHLFFEAARAEGVLLSVGSDAHNQPNEVADIDDALEFIFSRGLEKQVITPEDLKEEP
ncbi:PHP domain-containing protein [Acidobacteriota bacterium]